MHNRSLQYFFLTIVPYKEGNWKTTESLSFFGLLREVEKRRQGKEREEHALHNMMLKE